MVLMLDAERQLLANCSKELSSWINNFLIRPIRKNIGIIPKDLLDLTRKLDGLERSLRTSPASGLPETPHEVFDSDLSILKYALIHKRKYLNSDILDKKNITVDHDLHHRLNEQIKPYDALIGKDWFESTTTETIRSLTDYLSLNVAEEFLRENYNYKLNDRIYDEKFGILTSPQLFFHDLNYYRMACEIRKTSLCSAYIDIDDFKQFNTRHTEPIIDRNLLPKFMSVLEGHVFSRGQAYRFGGDEYTLILPSMPQKEAANFIHQLQVKLSQTEYYGISEKPTISVGLFEVLPTTYLTNKEIEEITAKAKAFAKNSGKNCISYLSDPNKIDDNFVKHEI